MYDFNLRAQSHVECNNFVVCTSYSPVYTLAFQHFQCYCEKKKFPVTLRNNGRHGYEASMTCTCTKVLDEQYRILMMVITNINWQQKQCLSLSSLYLCTIIQTERNNY